MSKIVNNPTINDSEVVNEIRSAIEHRATWMYYLMDEARKEGLDWEGFARPRYHPLWMFARGQFPEKDRKRHLAGI